ncbi:MAG: pilin [Candidatus Thiodiazotropha endolucinida]
MDRIITIEKIALLVLLPFLILNHAMAGKFYKCTDENGEIQYQQVACNSTIKQDTVHVYTGPKYRSQLGPKLMNDDEYITQEDEPALTNRFKFQSELTQVLSLLSPIKMAVINFYMMNGSWPETPQALGFNQDNLKSSQIKQVLIGDKGAIVTWLSNNFGKEKKLVLAPFPVMDGTNFEWQCLANFPAQALELSGNSLCESRASY